MKLKYGLICFLLGTAPSMVLADSPFRKLESPRIESLNIPAAEDALKIPHWEERKVDSNPLETGLNQCTPLDPRCGTNNGS